MIVRTVLAILILFTVAACDIIGGDTASNTENEEQTIAQADEPTEAEVVVEPTVEPTAEPVVIEPTAEPTVEEVVVEPTVAPTVAPTAEPETSAYAGPNWANYELTNAATGETFTLADFAGKTVFLEPMATWCTNCRAQQTRVAQAMGQLGTNDYVFISMSVGENVTNGVLAEYATRNGFPQIFIVGPSNLVNDLVQEFGFSVTNPPSTPHVIIGPDGTVEPLSTGSRSADELVTELSTIQNG